MYPIILKYITRLWGMPQIRVTIEDIDLKDGFLDLPNIENITEEPPEQYELETHGRIHTSSFMDLVRLAITAKPNNWQGQLDDILGAHVHKDELFDLTLNQFIDYLIHIIAANESIKYTEMPTIKHIILKETQHIPRWELPSLQFNDGISNLLSTIVKLSVAKETINHLQKISTKLLKLDNNQVRNLIDTNLIDKLESERRINIEELFNLIGNLRIIQQRGIIKYQQFPAVMEQVSDWCRQIWEDDYLDTNHKRILFSILNTVFFVNITPTSIKEGQMLLQQIEQDLIQLPKVEQQSYQWLVDAAHAIIANYLMQYEIEAVTEDVLLRSIGTRFIQPEEADLSRWKEAIITTGIHPLFSIILLRGYMSFSDLLHRYKTQLHQPELQNQQLIDQFIMDLLHSNKVKPCSLSFFAKITITDVYVSTAFKFLLRNEHTPKMINQLHDQIESSPISSYYQLIDIVVSIITGKYDFETKIARIGLEQDVDLIGNNSFENLVMSKYAEIFQHTQIIQDNTDEHTPRRYNMLRFYLFEWLIQLIDRQEDPIEAIMIILPFIKICDSLLQSYHARVNHTTMNRINQINLFLLELNLSVYYQHPPLSRLSADVNTEEIIAQVEELIGKFNLEDKIDPMDMKFYALDHTVDLPYITQSFNDTTIQSDKLEEENMIYYMELGDKFQKCLQDLDNSTVENIQNWFSTRCIDHDTPAFELEDFYGISQPNTPVKFPFMKPTSELATALRFFPIDLKLEELALPE